MAEVAALFKQFIYRDLAFVFGGFIVLLSLAYAFRGCIPSHWQEYWDKFPIPSTVLTAAAAYVVGYAVQDVGGVLRLTLTSRFKPGWVLQRLYKCFSQVSWQDPTYPNVREFEFEIHMGRRKIPEHVLQALERIRSLKVISMCVGGCLAVSALIFAVQLVLTLLGRLAWNGACVGLPYPVMAPSRAIDLVICIASAVLAACLICLGRIKGMQEMQFYQSIAEANFPVTP
jgi:hypothetical protein